MKYMSRDELIELVNRIVFNDFSTEEESWEAVELLKANVPDPKVTDYIFWHEPIDKIVDAAEVVDRALAYQSSGNDIPSMDDANGS